MSDFKVNDNPSTPMCTYYVLSAHALNLVSNKLWSTDFIDTITKTTQSVMDGIISVFKLPVNLKKNRPTMKPPLNTTYNINFGGKTIVEASDGISGSDAATISGRWLVKDITVDIPVLDESFGRNSFIQYDCDVSLYLPFVGTVELDPGDIMGLEKLTISYCIDVSNGNIMVTISNHNQLVDVDGPIDTNERGFCYTFTGNCAMPIPVTGATNTPLYQSLANTAGTAGLAVGAAVAGGPGVAVAGLGVAAAGTAASGLLFSPHRNIMKGNTSVGNASYMWPKSAWYVSLIISRRKVASTISPDWNTFAKMKGLPYYKSDRLANIHGFTTIDKLYINKLNAEPGTPSTETYAAPTTEEIEELERLLKEGVYFPYETTETT